MDDDFLFNSLQTFNENQNPSRKYSGLIKRDLYNIFMQSPAMLCILKGPDHKFVLVNKPYRELIGNRDPVGKTLKEALPELEGQGFHEILNKVYSTGESFTGKEMRANLLRNGKLDEVFLNVNYQPFSDSDKNIEGIFVFLYEVTEQVISRKKIKESQSKYLNLISGLPVAVYTCDEKGYIQLYNEAAVTLWGRIPKIGTDLWCGSWKIFRMNEEYLPSDKWPLAMALKDGFISNTEIVIQRPDGSKRNVIPYPQPIYDVNGNITGAINTLVDISEQVKSRKQMEQVAEMVEKLYMNAPAFICTLKGPDHVYELVNPEYQKIYGNRQLVGKKIADAIPEIITQGIIEKLDKVYQTGNPYVVTERKLYLSRDEGKEPETTYLNFSYQPMYDTDKKINGILVFGYDVTKQVLARKEGEDNLKRILESLPQITSTCTGNGTNFYFNKFFFEYSGLSKEEAAVNGWDSILHLKEMNEVQEQWEACKKSGQDFYREIRLKRKSDGVFRWHISHITPIKNNKGEVTQWIGSATDIHEQKIKEQKKDEFMSIASHEMKTPLTSVKAYLQLLELSLDKNNIKANTFTKKAILSVDRLKDLIGELLDVSKIQNGRLSLNITEFNFNEMVDDAIDAIQYNSPKHSLLKTGTISELVIGDKERLQQVLINLLSNAVKYSPDSTDISINTCLQNNSITVSVKDNGIGISEDNYSKIFERYYRVEGQKIHIQGLGIGLFISMDIVTRHEGKLWVESQPGIGSTFYFTIPLKRK
ncbi:MAG: PAS domain-containing protein [Ginsengibacter sp.]